MSELTEPYRRAADGFARRLAQVSGTQWGSPTPCSEWSVRDLVAHVLDEQLWIPPLVAGETIAEVGDRFGGDQIGDDAAASWSAAQTAVLSTLAEDGVEARMVGLSYGVTTAADYVSQVTVDTLVHTWDLARAIGADERLDVDGVSAAIDAVAPTVDTWRSSGLFGPAVPVAADADPQTRLLALLGRAP